MRLIFITSAVIISFMYICICNAITERQVLESVEQGARTLADLQVRLGVATCCGCCAETAVEYLPGGRYASASAPVPLSADVAGPAANDALPELVETVCRRA